MAAGFNRRRDVDPGHELTAKKPVNPVDMGRHNNLNLRCGHGIMITDKKTEIQEAGAVK
jgi:hypothetical protein